MGVVQEHSDDRRMMDVNPGWVLRRAMRIGLPVRPRAAIIGET
jgi:hypothetical protein